MTTTDHQTNFAITITLCTTLFLFVAIMAWNAGHMAPVPEGVTQAVTLLLGGLLGRLGPGRAGAGGPGEPPAQVVGPAGAPVSTHEVGDAPAGEPAP